MLAPMVGITHRAFRELVGEFGGCDLLYTEMASAGGSAAASLFEKYFLDPGPAPERTVVQYYTTDLASLERAFDRTPEGVFGVDINFGCSAPHIERQGGGVRWMKDREGAASLVRCARERFPRLSVSAKLRLGYEDDYDALLAFCLALRDAGADYLCLHPRLKSQKLKRLSNWDYVARIARDTGLPMVGNGDIRGYGDWAARSASIRPAGIMIGREAARQPWIFKAIRGKALDPGYSFEVNLRDVAMRFFELLERHLPPDFHYTRAQRFFAYFCDNFSFAHYCRTAMLNAPDLAGMKKALDAYFAEMPGDVVKTIR